MQQCSLHFFSANHGQMSKRRNLGDLLVYTQYRARDSDRAFLEGNAFALFKMLSSCHVLTVMECNNFLFAFP